MSRWRMEPVKRREGGLRREDHLFTNCRTREQFWESEIFPDGRPATISEVKTYIERRWPNSSPVTLIPHDGTIVPAAVTVVTLWEVSCQACGLTQRCEDRDKAVACARAHSEKHRALMEPSRVFSGRAPLENALKWTENQ